MHSNNIHPTCIIEGDVDLGINNTILPNSIIYGPTKIGNNNIIGPSTIIGTPGQDTKNPRYDASNCYIEIGDNNIIREFTAIQKPCYGNITRLGNDIFLMQSVHIPHDAIIHDKVSIAPMCVLAGLTTLLTGASISIGVTIHQYSVIGHYSMIAMGAAVLKNVKPFSIYIPDNPVRVNEYAINKFGFAQYKDEIAEYVLKSITPKSAEVAAVINEFEELHSKSKRKLYS